MVIGCPLPLITSTKIGIYVFLRIIIMDRAGALIKEFLQLFRHRYRVGLGPPSPSCWRRAA